MYNIIHFQQIDSTNTELKRRALMGAPSGTVLVADSQSAGRGRIGRSFFSPSGSGLYMSLLVSPIRPTDAGLLTTFTAVAVARALDDLGIQTGIKWVNDLIADGRKLCGILAEAGTRDGLPFAVIGIGVNLKKAAFPADLAPIAVSAEELIGKAPDRDALLNAILHQLSVVHLACPEDPAALMDEYRRRSLTLGRRIRVIPHGAPPYDAFAQAILDDGSLKVLTENGTRIVSSGQVSTGNGS